ncbi:ribosomal-protein-alanine acetyltransferase [Hyphomonas neptunium ATCC 15444]|uniref:[Ribosomal protein bS18]-alanine N-acetyltransferase n=2 Tax=Hyphomonas TaxID=85 RepID=Q0C4T7_HYPNA|nr:MULTISPECIES: ribosomal protein S18-alanine N-acetyltransferase [Hyphomonas]ABI78172.1 ribosomal-protein-alanine acetyltransferase [Hyphomonas neptunium ATCC 15444]KCZ96532.1 ribosomal-protein-alanine acetyltransferase [Hyphomonas hirschiana VP5]
MNQLLRPLARADATAAAALHAMCFPDPWSVKSFEETFEDEAVRAHGFWLGEQLVSFAMTKEVAGEADLLTIATDPARRLHGYAAQLIGALIVELEGAGITRMTLEVAEDNRAARQLYVRFGFTEDGRRRRYYEAGRDTPVDAVLMSRHLGV